MKNDLPFKDITVLELASVLAGPSVGMFFSELGANVIKVENIISNGDVTRHWKLGAEDPQTDITAYYTSINWGKKSIAIDISKKEGLEIVYELVKISDIILASYKPGDAEKLKVDYNTLKSVKKDIIYGCITGYGQNNHRAGYDAIIQAEAGFMFMNGEPDNPPTKMPVALMDVLAAHQLKEGILIALLKKNITGEGSFVEASLFQSGVASLVNQATNYLVANHIPQRLGSDHPNIAPYGTVFVSKDNKEFVIAVGSDKQFYELCEILEMPELAKDPKFAKNIDRVKNKTELKAILKKLFSNFTRKEILKKLDEKKIPAGAVNNMKEVFETKEAQELIINKNNLKGVRSAVFKIDNLFLKNPDIQMPPHYGEHTIEICRNILKMPDENIKNLINNKVLHCYESVK
jgi:crotonobetainyl-CoA:carnitine CoA-transferase CaiB-like acyl-CoA transferase